MKTLLKTLTFSFVLMSFAAFGSEMNHKSHSGHANEQKGMHSGHHSSAGKEVTLKGELIGLTCFVKHGSKGSSHKSCAKDCAEKGLPIGLLSDGKIYQVSGEGHESLKDAYKPLLKYLEGNVMVKGTVFEKNGTSLLVVKKIKKS